MLTLKAAGPGMDLPKQLQRGSSCAAGYDLCSLQHITLCKGLVHKVATGVHLAIPEGYVGIVKERSGLALEGIEVHGGVIDSDYRGEISVIMRYEGRHDAYAVDVGEKIAQIVFVKHEAFSVSGCALGDLDSTQRGTDGFGSTGN